MLCFLGRESEVIVEAQHDDDRRFVEAIGANLVAVDIGAGDWVDHDIFRPGQDERFYDCVMVAAWSRLKRHELFFDALSRLRPRRLRAALIGYEADLRRRDIVRLLRRYSLTPDVDVFENVPPETVARIVASSKMALHLSRAEGANKASYEALFCDTPLLVYRGNLGFRLSILNAMTGILVDEGELPHAIAWMVENHRTFRPREWALRHTGCETATRRLNGVLRDLALAQGEPWERDIVVKVNRPNLRYKRNSDRLALEPAYECLAEYLAPGA